MGEAMTKAIVLTPSTLCQARERLAAEGFTVSPVPLEALEYGIVMVAYRETIGLEGFLIGLNEVGLVARYGLDYLDPHPGRPKPRHMRDVRNREAKYAEAVLAKALAEIAQSGPGGRNQALNRAAYSVGRVAHFGLDPEKTIHELVEAAQRVGLPFPEAGYTAKKAFAKGQQNPRTLGGGL